MSKTFYITTPIYYPSGKLHIGHSYTTVAADAMARYKRIRGYDVMFLTGTDEHGQKIQRKAEEKGISPKQYVDEIVGGIQDLWKLLNITNDKFIRTTDEEHEKSVQQIFTKLYEQGDIYKSEYTGWYCTPCEAFWTEHQLKDGKCPDCDRPVEKTKEECYFFKLSKYQDRLIKLIEENPDFMLPVARQNEMLNNFLRPGLEDLAVSRTTFNWGIPVPFDPKHVIYVWIDALSNYITALGYLGDNDEAYKKFWPADVQLVGKEIVRFHTIIWPAMLMALDLPIPKQVFGHGWLLLEGGKMSKSKGNVVDPEILVDKYGVDAIRYFLLREVPFGSDGIFSNEALISRINADLANDLGNLVSRTVAMVEKYFGGTMPTARAYEEIDEELKQLSLETVSSVEELMEKLQFSSALTEIWKLVSRTNKYIDQTAPWVLAKDGDKESRLATVLYNLAESIRITATLIEPFMPNTTPLVRKQLGVTTDEECTWDSTKVWGTLSPSFTVQKGDALFPRIDMEKELEALAALTAQNDQPSAPQTAPIKETVSIEDFAKLDFRVATVLSAEPIPKSDKLLKLQLDTGSEVRQVVSGIAKHYTPESLVGKQVVMIANLKPVKLRGVESNGMILAASDLEDTKLILATVDAAINNGAEVR